MSELSEAQISSRKRWADALLGGDYIQGRGGLRRDNTFCCLGVACDLVDPSGWNFPIDRLRPRFVRDGETNIYLPPKSVLDEFGLTSGEAGSLAAWNDRGGRFEEIAAVILGEGDALADSDEA